MWFGESAGQGGVQIGELGMAFLLSALIGLEREIRHKSAGLRTHTLVGFSAALIIGAGLPILAIFVTGLHFVMVFAFPLVVERLPRSKWTPSGLQVSYQDGKGILRSVLVKLSEIPGVVAVNATDEMFVPISDVTNPVLGWAWALSLGLGGCRSRSRASST
jgi:hypothetical protein